MFLSDDELVFSSALRYRITAYCYRHKKPERNVTSALVQLLYRGWSWGSRGPEWVGCIRLGGQCCRLPVRTIHQWRFPERVTLAVLRIARQTTITYNVLFFSCLFFWYVFFAKKILITLMKKSLDVNEIGQVLPTQLWDLKSYIWAVHILFHL